MDRRTIFISVTIFSIFFFFYLAQSQQNNSSSSSTQIEEQEQHDGFISTTTPPAQSTSSFDIINRNKNIKHQKGKTTSSSYFDKHLQDFIETGKQCYLSRWGGYSTHGEDVCPHLSLSKNQQKLSTTTISVEKKSTKTESKVSATYFPKQNCLKIELEKKMEGKGKYVKWWGHDDETSTTTRKLGRELRVEGGWTEGLVLLSSSSSTATNSKVLAVKRFFMWEDRSTTSDNNNNNNENGDSNTPRHFSSCICDAEFLSADGILNKISSTGEGDASSTSTSTSYSLQIMMFELYKSNDAIAETGEDLPVQYFTPTASHEKTVLMIPLKKVLLPTNSNNNNNNLQQVSVPVVVPKFADWKVYSQDVSTNYQTDPRFGGYWLKFKGDTTRGDKYSDTHDLLGRMDFRVKFQFSSSSSTSSTSSPSSFGQENPNKLQEENDDNNFQQQHKNNNDEDRYHHSKILSGCAQQVAPPPCPKDTCFLLSSSHNQYQPPLRNRIVVFIGDSHVRTLYYGLLERLGLPFAANKVWRGGHETSVKALNCELKFVPSSFLEVKVLENTLSQILLQHQEQKNKKQQQQIVFVAGVGQHHSTHCYTLRRHTEILEKVFDFFSKTRNNNNMKFRVIWFGIPAQPVNRHLFAPKPVGQARKDCRTNSRHLLYSAIQQTMCRLASSTTSHGVDEGGDYKNNNNNNDDQDVSMIPSPIPFIDAFALTAGLTFTSIDGAHYYSFARDAMLDSLGEELGKLL